MKLVCLNVWGGKIYEPLMDFIKSSDADIFCFQEILKGAPHPGEYRTNIFSLISEALPEFTGFFAARQKRFVVPETVDFDVDFGQAIFVRKILKVEGSGTEIVRPGKDVIKDARIDLPTIVQHVTLKYMTVFNFHGIAPWPKDDTPERLEQSKNLRKIMDSFHGRKLLCGDFNLNPNTESMAIVEKNMRNLIKEFGIKSTRPASMSKKGTSDYIIVSKDVKTRKFSVPEILVSDHLPLILEFE
jgi:endonuclease/exonuclease/phosphatase family metal-dependent hydrolase